MVFIFPFCLTSPCVWLMKFPLTAQSVMREVIFYFLRFHWRYLYLLFCHQRFVALFVLTALTVVIGFVSVFDTQLMKTVLSILV